MKYKPWSQLTTEIWIGMVDFSSFFLLAWNAHREINHFVRKFIALESQFNSP